MVIEVRWYFRPNEIPDSVYMPLMQDRITENSKFFDTYQGPPLSLSLNLNLNMSNKHNLLRGIKYVFNKVWDMKCNNLL